MIDGLKLTDRSSRTMRFTIYLSQSPESSSTRTINAMFLYLVLSEMGPCNSFLLGLVEVAAPQFSQQSLPGNTLVDMVVYSVRLK